MTFVILVVYEFRWRQIYLCFAFAELQTMRDKMRSLQQQLSQSEQIARELRAQEGDMMEALKAKDAQLAVLRVRFEDTEKELREKVRTMDGLKNEKDRYGSSYWPKAKYMNSMKLVIPLHFIS